MSRKKKKQQRLEALKATVNVTEEDQDKPLNKFASLSEIVIPNTGDTIKALWDDYTVSSKPVSDSIPMVAIGKGGTRGYISPGSYSVSSSRAAGQPVATEDTTLSSASTTFSIQDVKYYLKVLGDASATSIPAWQIKYGTWPPSPAKPKYPVTSVKPPPMPSWPGYVTVGITAEAQDDARFERMSADVAFSNRVFLRSTLGGTPSLARNYDQGGNGRKWEISDSIFGSNLVTSLIIDDPDERKKATMTNPAEVLDYLAKKGKAGEARHMPVLDFDVPIQVLPSSQLGHYHLYIDHEVGWNKYVKIMEAFEAAGIVEKGFVSASKEKGWTGLRPPGVTKPDAPKGV
jgi:hypothetical protein